MLLFSPPEILPTGHFSRGPHSTVQVSHCSSFLQALAFEHPRPVSSAPTASPAPGVGVQNELPWHLHVATAGPDRLVQHLEAHGAVEGRDGQLRLPPALQGPGGGRSRRGFAAIAAQHGSHRCSSHRDSCQELRACCRVVLLSCGGGRKSRPSCDRRLPERAAKAA